MTAELVTENGGRVYSSPTRTLLGPPSTASREPPAKTQTQAATLHRMLLLVSTLKYIMVGQAFLPLGTFGAVVT